MSSYTVLYHDSDSLGNFFLTIHVSMASQLHQNHLKLICKPFENRWKTCLLVLKGVSGMTIALRNTLSKILKYVLPTYNLLEEKWGFLEIFLADIYFIACYMR